MKSFNKFFIITFAFAALFTLTIPFVSCSDDDSDDPSIIATYKATDNGGTYTLNTYDNNTFILTGTLTTKWSGTVSKGTYKLTGTPTDGTVEITTTQDINNQGVLVAVSNPKPVTVTITNGKFTYKQTTGTTLSFEKQ